MRMLATWSRDSGWSGGKNLASCVTRRSHIRSKLSSTGRKLDQRCDMKQIDSLKDNTLHMDASASWSAETEYWWCLRGLIWSSGCRNHSTSEWWIGGVLGLSGITALLVGLGGVLGGDPLHNWYGSPTYHCRNILSWAGANDGEQGEDWVGLGHPAEDL
jgi:hypothetical protein